MRRASTIPFTLCCAALAVAANAHADEPRLAREPHILADPGEVTDVVDAFDDDDPFDLHVTLGFQQTWKHATIRRESYVGNTANPLLSTGGFTAGTQNVGEYTETTSRLNTRVDIGIYRDIALYLRMPIILSNSRAIDDLGGSQRMQGVVLAGAPGEQLFNLPFRSPQRSGIDYLAVGADFALLNQARDATKPTWTIGAEGRFSIGEPMHACTDTPKAGQVGCAYPSDINRNGTRDANSALDPSGVDTSYSGSQLEGQFAGSRSAGVSRGTNAIEVHTLLSKRIKYVEPYGGFRMLAEFAQGRSDFGATDLKGSVVNHPPLQGWMVLGLQVIPWEQREQFQRLTFDFRFTGAYRSEGRDYSELFDALGSSSAASLRRPNFASYQRNTDPATSGTYSSVVAPGSQKIYFTGITDVAPYGTFQLSTSMTWQAGEYIKFQVGAGWTHEQSHYLSLDQPCNPDFKDDVGQSGPCKTASKLAVGGQTVTGIPNPNHRPTISLPGNRFLVDGSNLWDAWISGIVMF